MIGYAACFNYQHCVVSDFHLIANILSRSYDAYTYISSPRILLIYISYDLPYSATYIPIYLRAHVH